MTFSDIDRSTLLRTYLLRGVPQPIFENLIACATVKQLGKDQVLFRQGETADHFFVVLEGWVKVSRISAAGDEAVLGDFGSGEAFAEAAMLLGG
ncbi:MAG: cyclic nucleotide-binding domain-containing protein, partial [Hoeflea sp.]